MFRTFGLNHLTTETLGICPLADGRSVHRLHCDKWIEISAANAGTKPAVMHLSQPMPIERVLGVVIFNFLLY